VQYSRPHIKKDKARVGKKKKKSTGERKVKNEKKNNTKYKQILKNKNLKRKIF